MPGKGLLSPENSPYYLIIMKGSPLQHATGLLCMWEKPIPDQLFFAYRSVIFFSARRTCGNAITAAQMARSTNTNELYDTEYTNGDSPVPSA